MSVLGTAPQMPDISNLSRQIESKQTKIAELEKEIQHYSATTSSRPSRSNSLYNKSGIIQTKTGEIYKLNTEIQDIRGSIERIREQYNRAYDTWKQQVRENVSLQDAASILQQASQNEISMEERADIYEIEKKNKTWEFIRKELQDIKRQEEEARAQAALQGQDQSASLESVRMTAQGGPKRLTDILRPVVDSAVNYAIQTASLQPTPENKEMIKAHMYSHTTSRITLGDKSTGSQCVNTIGNAKLDDANYSKLMQTQCNDEIKKFVMDSSRLDVLDQIPGSNERCSKCWLCGLPLGPRDGPTKFRPECEHVLPVALAASFFGIYDSAQQKSAAALASARRSGDTKLERDIYNYLNTLAKNYSWAHSSCNAHDKGHFDANPEDPLVNYTPQGLMPVPNTYEKIVNGWEGPDGNIVGGMKNRLRDTLLKCLNESELNQWANNRVKILQDSYTRTTQSINQELSIAPNLYTLGLIGDYLENVTTHAKNSIEFYSNQGLLQNGGTIKSKKRKSKRKANKKTRRKNKYRINKKTKRHN